MAGSLNRVQLIGNVGKDPEIRNTQDGRPIANFSVATSESWKDKNSGERKEITDWHNIVCFNEKLCGVIEKYVRKGSKIYVEGAQKTRKWQDQQGNDRYSTEVVLQPYNGNLILLDGPSGNSISEASENGHSEPSGGKQAMGGGRAFSDEIPF